eukprot:2239792-Amphidinium_carterae.1
MASARFSSRKACLALRSLLLKDGALSKRTTLSKQLYAQVKRMRMQRMLEGLCANNVQPSFLNAAIARQRDLLLGKHFWLMSRVP